MLIKCIKKFYNATFNFVTRPIPSYILDETIPVSIESPLSCSHPSSSFKTSYKMSKASSAKARSSFSFQMYMMLVKITRLFIRIARSSSDKTRSSFYFQGLWLRCTIETLFMRLRVVFS